MTTCTLGTAFTGSFTVQEVANAVPYKKRLVEVQAYQYTPDTSPLTFRNYPTLLTDKEFKHEIILDSKFWASEVQVMPYKQPTGGAEWQTINSIYGEGLKWMPYYRPDTFFVNYSPQQ